MAQDWDHIVVPFVSGLDDQVDELAKRPPTLETADNVSFDKNGTILSRPGYGEDTTDVVTAGTRVAAFTSISAHRIRSIFPVRESTGPSTAVLGDGRLWSRVTNNAWFDKGRAWSGRIRDMAAEQGSGVQGSSHSVAAGGQFVVVAENSQLVRVLSLATGAWVADKVFANVAGPIIACNVGDNIPAVIFRNTSNQIKLNVLTESTVTWTETQLATDASSSVAQHLWAIWDATGGAGRLFVVYRTTTATDVKLLAVNTVPAVANSVTFVNGNAINTVCVAINSTVVGIACGESAGTLDVKTKVYSRTCVDQAIDVTLAPAAATAPSQVVIGPGPTGANKFFVASQDSTNWDLEIWRRSSTAATSALIRTYFGSNTSPDPRWHVLTAPFLARGRSVMGLVWETKGSIGNFAFIDLSEENPDGQTDIVATGPINAVTGTEFAVPCIQGQNDKVFFFGYGHWTTFEAQTFGPSGVTSQDVPARLDFSDAVPFAQAGDANYVGGATTFEYDGVICHEANFFGFPRIIATVSAGGSITAGSHSFAAVWAWEDALGRLHRSAPSATVSATTSAGNQTVTVTFTKCQITQKHSSIVHNVRIELYRSDLNPTANSPFFLITTITNDFTSANGTQAYTADLTAADKEKEILYTVGGVMPNSPPPSSARGLVSAGRRIWAGAEDRVCPSKLVRPGEAPGWHEFLEIPIPRDTGSITALSPFGDGILAFTEAAVWHVQGPGPDDSNFGQDFSEPVRVAEVGCSGPRSVVQTPVGVVFQAKDGHVYLFSGGLQAQRISRQVTSSVTYSATSQLAHISSLETVLIFLAAGMLAWNYRVNQWATWTLAASADRAPFSGCEDTTGFPIVLAATSGVGVFAVGSFTAPGQNGSDRGFAFTSQIKTAWIRVSEDRLGGWGRARGGRLSGGAVGAPGAVAAVIVTGFDKSAAYIEQHDFLWPSSAAVTWPSERDQAEFRYARQKASMVQLTISLTPGQGKFVELELDVRKVAHRAPPNQRK